MQLGIVTKYRVYYMMPKAKNLAWCSRLRNSQQPRLRNQAFTRAFGGKNFLTARNHFMCCRDRSFSRQTSSINSVSTMRRSLIMTVHGFV